MSALPLNLIKGTRNASYERLENTEDIEDVEQNIQRIKSKVWCCFTNYFSDFSSALFLKPLNFHSLLVWNLDT